MDDNSEVVTSPSSSITVDAAPAPPKSTSATSIDLSSVPESRNSDETVEDVIQIEAKPEEILKKEEFDEEPKPEVEGPKPEGEEPKPEGEGQPEGDKQGAGEKQEAAEKPTDAAAEEAAKPPVKVRTSNDETDQIQAHVETEDVSLDIIRRSIRDPDMMNQVENIFGQIRSNLGPAIEFSPCPSSIEEEEVPESEIISYLAELGYLKEKEPINREAYEEEYKTLKEASVVFRRKNGLLNKKITEYYRKRKMNRVFEEVTADVYETTLEKYEQKIEDLYELQLKSLRERQSVDNEIKDMTNFRDEHLQDLENSFAEMQAREREISHGLIDNNTGKVISDKLVDRLLNRQQQKSREIAKIRLGYIRRRDKVKEIDNKIKSLETIGGTLHLMDFEQLRMENQTFTDKIEERDDELMRLRDRYAHAIQAIAHIREKINIIEAQIDELQDKETTEKVNVTRARECLNKLKIQRDTNRAQRDKIKTNSGILTYPKLLMDMEIGITDLSKLRSELQELIVSNKQYRVKLTNIRNAIERTEHVQSKRTQRRMRRMKGTRRYYVNRPTLAYPVLPKIAYLKSHISKMSVDDSNLLI